MRSELIDKEPYTWVLVPETSLDRAALLAIIRAELERHRGNVIITDGGEGLSARIESLGEIDEDGRVLGEVVVTREGQGDTAFDVLDALVAKIPMALAVVGEDPESPRYLRVMRKLQASEWSRHPMADYLSEPLRLSATGANRMGGDGT